jgi:hypothetical protein
MLAAHVMVGGPANAKDKDSNPCTPLSSAEAAILAEQTAQAASALLTGLTEGGAHGDIVYLPLLAIERCRQCGNTGWGTCRSAGQ